MKGHADFPTPHNFNLMTKVLDMDMNAGNENYHYPNPITPEL